MKNGVLVISLDFELHWGVRDKRTVASYRENLLGVRVIVPELLRLFKQYQVHATWATVGFLFFRTQRQLINSLPRVLPEYQDAHLSPYPELAQIGADESLDPYHFAPSLIELISQYPHQEIATHTFSHYYALAKGQSIEAFAADMESAVSTAQQYGFEIRSLVFPRNQTNREYLQVCKKLGIVAYRGNQKSWIYHSDNEDNSKIGRGLRLLDAYLNLTGHNTYELGSIGRTVPVDIPASRFLRPYSAKLKGLESIRLNRILKDLDNAARNGLFYHLWWHPHNFGRDQAENLAFLEAILLHFEKLRASLNFSSMHMSEVATLVRGEN